MSSTQENRAGATYSTTDTRDKPADPYKEVNSDVDVPIKEKVEDLIAFVEGVKLGMMTTRQSQSGLLVSRCMSLVARENGIDFLFHTNTETGKTDELHSDPHVNLGFLKNSTGEWASISGIAAIDTDREKVRQYYTPALKAWVGDLGDKIHGGDPKDPRLAVIKVHAKTATYSLQKGTALSRGLEIAKGSIIGNVANTNELRELTEEELQTFRNSQQLIS
ncbi:hypothetical protein B9Z19DRAFT_977072 [Tuber borchii]|uniref:General stress protein FMN-binding split barrel domain-containing protein n=1 Tax=Tuber borchii TaxID=42251 RepID=A0A2T6ZWR6_TUBBO|nr:hypothetical protein B9Z19DRAFT_977072 [Tuber borchii]